MIKITTKEYMDKYGVTETIIAGRPKFTREYDKKWKSTKKRIERQPIHAKLNEINKFVAESRKHATHLICYRVDLVNKVVVEEIEVPLNEMPDFAKKNFRESVLFSDLHFNDGKPIKNQFN